MRKVYKFIPLLAIFFVFNCFSAYAKIINPLLYLQNKKTSKVSKNKKDINIKKSTLHKKNKKSSSSAEENHNLQVSTIIPEEEDRDYIMPSKNITYSSIIKDNIMEEIKNWYSTRYKWGGRSKRGIDCSGFTSMIYEKVLGILLPHSSREQIKIGKKIDNFQDLKFGDLVFFKSKRRNPGHVGIYIGDGIFAHSSSGSNHGVGVSRLDDETYLKRYVGARRILDEPRTVIGGE